MNLEEQIPVVIVGAGPVGLATAYVLGMHGVRSVVYEQFDGINPHPRAHVVNTRSMELLRNWGVVDGIVSDAVDLTCGLSFVWKHTVAGEEFGRIDLADSPPEQLSRRFDSSPVTISSCAQDRVQQRLLDAVRDQGVATVRFGARVTEVDDHGDAVTISVETGGGTEQLRADYLVIAEGAAGSIRRALGIKVEGIPEFGRQINVYFHADLTRWTDTDPALLFWVLNTGCPGVIIRMGANRWTFNIGYDPALETVADYTPKRCVELIRAAVGAPELEVEVRSVGSWVLGASTATQYRKGRVFLAGDSAHQFPPTGGLGMNTGLVDADNLSWKLAAVLNGWAPEGLLDTYCAERRPVALANAQSSIANAVKMADAGIGPNTIEVAARLESSDPAVAAAERVRLGAAVPEQRPHFDHLELEIGYIYAARNESDLSVDPITHAVPGGRLPHGWIIKEGTRISTLDLVQPGFTLIAGCDGIGWVHALAEVAGAVPARAFVAGRDFEFEGAATCGLSAAGAVLVRPDGHVAWYSAEASVHPDDDLARALDVALVRTSAL
ncbi:FAD-dependent monooxygenase [Nocardia gipuzkoensis]